MKLLSVMKVLLLCMLVATCHPKAKKAEEKKDKKEPNICAGIDVSMLTQVGADLLKAPAFVVNVEVTGNTVRTFWKKKGNQAYSVLRDGVALPNTPCYCGEYVDQNVPAGSHTYSVNGTTVTVLVQGTGGGGTPVPTNNIIMLDFDGQTVSGTSWNYSGDMYFPPSGLSQEKIDSIVTGFKTALAQFPVTVITDERLFHAENGQRIIFTPYYQWFGAVSGTSFEGTFGEIPETPCFVFTSILADLVNACITAGVHEGGHTLDLTHAVDTCGTQQYGTAGQWMGSNFQLLPSQHYWQAPGISKTHTGGCATVNEPQVILNKLTK